ncbi:MAG: TetR/AcrR family transcriptional regulator [Aeromicrobium sp.]
MSEQTTDDPSTWGTPEGRHMIDLLWDPPAPATRGPRQKLTLEQVVDTAMSIAAEEGVDALSMRKVATALGVGAMSLYTYVPGRDELFELMIDRAWAVRRLPDRELPWRAQVEFHAREAWAMFEQYPWLIRSNVWRMPLGPHVLDVQEDLYRALDLTGLPPLDVARVTGLVEAHVFGTARSRITDTSVSANTGVTADEYWESRSSFWGTYYSEERFPTMTALWNAKAFDQPIGDDDYGLEILLDGVEALIDSRR